jgi:pantetheine-phosphate adenylyltransferase
MRKNAIYAGTFDPLTFGHLDLIERSAEIFGHVILAVAQGSLKETLFTVEERVTMITSVVKKMKNVEVVHFDGLLIKYAKARGVGVLIRGIRAYSDFEYEFQMALTNRKLDSAIETLFMMPKETHSYISSSTVKEVASLGGDIRDFVPTPVVRALRNKYKCKSK